MTLGDMPAGWKVDTSANDNSDQSTPKCFLSQDLSDTEPTAEIEFARGQGFSTAQFKESLNYLGSETDTLFNQVINVLDNCKHTTFTSDGKNIRATVSRVSFPEVGEDTHAYKFAFTVSGIHVALYLCLTHKGETALGTFMFSLSGDIVGQFARLTAKAYRKIT